MNKPLAYYHDVQRDVYRLLISTTGNKLDAVWVDVTADEYWPALRGAA